MDEDQDLHESTSVLRQTSRDQNHELDETERQLEQLIFGKGFHENLQAAQHPGTTPNLDIPYLGKQRSLDQNGGLEIQEVDDSDLFFLDSGPTAVDVPALSRTRSASESSDSSNAPAWVDSDDERLVISLASNTRLRKLRHAESEDLVNGKEYTKRLRRQFETLHPAPEWAKPSAAKRRKRRRDSGTSDSSNDSSNDDMSIDSDDLSTQPLAKLLRDPSALNQNPSVKPGTRRKLRPETIDLHRLKDVGGAQPSTITSLAFHPIHPILLTSGPSGLVSLYHISPSPTTATANPLITTLHVRSTPLSTSAFLAPVGRKLFFSAPRKYFHIWDLDSGHVAKVTKIHGHSDEQRSMERFKLSPCGRWMGLVGSGRKGGGYINVVDAGTCQWVAEVRVEGNGGVADFCWWGDGEGMVALGKGGEAVEYSLRERRVLARWTDDGAVGTTVAALGGHGAGPGPLGADRWLAVGSSSGVVNLYDRRRWKNADGVPSRPKPTRALDQLTTPTSHLAFSPDGQVLCMSSRWKRDALRLVHLPSRTVYRNWPTAATPLGRIGSVAWSANGEMLAVGNEQGKVRLWEIRG